MQKDLNAVLVIFSTGVFPNTRTDRAITDEVKQSKDLGDGAGEWKKRKLPKESLVPIQDIAGEAYRFHKHHTGVWEEGRRLLSAKARAKYEARMKEYETEFWEAVDEFGSQYQSWIEQAKIMHRGTFDPADYPAWPACREMFHFSLDVCPVPKPEHFNAEMKALYGQALQVLTEKKIGDSIADAWERLLEPVLKMADALASPDKVFRDSLIDNIKEMVAVIPELNITDDAALKSAAAEIEKHLASFQPDLLRDDKVVRKDAADKAKALAARFGAMGFRKFAEAA